MPDVTTYYYKWDFKFWDEIYEGEKDSKNERSGNGNVIWNLDVSNQWRFEDWALWHTKNHEKYDLDKKEHKDRKLTNNKIIFKGNWINNYPHGEGKFYLNDQEFFKGSFVDGFLHGKAKFKITFITLVFGIYNNYLKVPGYSNIESEEEYNQKMITNEEFGEFEGEFKDGLADGKGQLILKSGISYKGDWKEGYPHGHGFRTYIDGTEELGEFGILNENSLKLQTEYVSEPNGQLLKGTRTFANGYSENVDQRTLAQKAKTFF